MPVSKQTKRFGSLLSAPAPLPNDDDDSMPSPAASTLEPEPPADTVPEPVVSLVEPEMSTPMPSLEPEPPAAAEPTTAERVLESAPSTPAAQPSSSTPARSQTSQITAPAPATDEPVAKVPTTLRLQPPAAAAFRDAWFDARRTKDPTLSSPVFASEIVMLGLEAYRKKGR